jgi:nucleoside 2-deoxyribosyltransferase
VLVAKIYIIGALKNRNIISLANDIRLLGYDVFDDWISAGEEADEKWQAYEAERGRSYGEAINGYHADTVFNYDLTHLKAADIVIMVLPCGKSGHLEFGWSIGQGKTGYILFDDGEPDRFDIMYRFADALYFDREQLLDAL